MLFRTEKKKKKIASSCDWITLTGYTKNIRGYAAVVSDSVGTFFVDGMEEWDAEWLDQTVKITGDVEPTVMQPLSVRTIRSAVVMLLQKQDDE